MELFSNLVNENGLSHCEERARKARDVTRQSMYSSLSASNIIKNQTHGLPRRSPPLDATA
jgi:hypothetical protein